MNQTPPPPPGHVSALINLRPTMGQIRLDPQDKLTPTPGQDWSEKSPTPRTRCQQNTPPTHTHRTKKCLRPTHPLRIISGTALNRIHFFIIMVFALWLGILSCSGRNVHLGVLPLVRIIIQLSQHNHDVLLVCMCAGYVDMPYSRFVFCCAGILKCHKAWIIRILRSDCG